VEVDITKDLPKEITITDSYGGKMKQQVEYEWKPTFCDKCQKFGHKCGVKKGPVKTWIPKTIPKEVNEEHMSANQRVVTPTRTVSSKNNDLDNGEWTKVSKGGRDKGKRPESAEAIIYGNGFETLGENAIVIHEDVP
jgi:hypothetical protein